MSTIARIYTDQELLALRDRIHAMALDHGWWPDINEHGHCNFPPGLLEEKLVLVSTELSEAYEVYRDGIKLDAVWLSRGDASTPEDEHSPRPGEVPPGDRRLAKPEGFPVELADAYIRILDLMGALRLTPQPVVIALSGREMTVGIGIFKFLRVIVDAGLIGAGSKELGTCLSQALAAIESFAHWFRINLKSAISQKMKYNATRPFRHGGKKA